MTTIQWTRRLAAASAVLLIAACSGGGGGNTLVTAPAPAPVPQVSIGQSGPIMFATPGSVGPALAQFPTATGTTPNFTNSFPAAGTTFPLLHTAINVIFPNATGAVNTQGASVTITGTQVVGGVTRAVLEFKLPEIGLDATGLIGDGTTVTLADGRKFTLWATSLNYSAFGAWNLTPIQAGGSGTYQFGAGMSGYQTPSANVPTGTATYLGNSATTGGVFGHVVTPDGTGNIVINSVTGDASIAVNFSTGNVNGSLTNMMVATTPTTSTPWNNVSLTGTMSGATLSGTTASSGTPPAGSRSFDASSTGTFNGSLFGPNGEELGAVWTLHDSTGQGKSALGFIGATKQ